MNLEELNTIINNGENLKVEFKSWKKAGSKKQRIELAVDELIAFANASGGTLFMGVEDSGEITGCDNYDTQNFIEAIYDKTRPPLFVRAEVLHHDKGDVIALHVDNDGQTYATTDGRCLKRLGKNSKPFYPEEMGSKYTISQNLDFSSKVIMDSSENDIDKLELYKFKERIRMRDPKSTLSDMEDIALLSDLGLAKVDKGVLRLTIAGLLFVGKEQSIKRMLPQAEVVYLHYSEDNPEEYDARLDLTTTIISVIDRLSERIQDKNKIVNVQVGLFRLEVVDYPENVFQEALLNALSHRDYNHLGAIYVKHYSDRIVIENPGGFIDGITENNIITHPSAPRNRLIADTLQTLKYVQRAGQGVDIIFREMISMGKPYPTYRDYGDAISLTVYNAIDDKAFIKVVAKEQNRHQKMFSLAELMILRYLTEKKRISLSEAENLTQTTRDLTQKSINKLAKYGLIETSGKEYMLTAKMYEAVKSDVEYTKDKSIQYIRAKDMILEYIKNNSQITNEKTRELCGFTKQQARNALDRMRDEGLIRLVGSGRSSKYILMN